MNASNYPFDGGISHGDDLIYLFPYPQLGSLDRQDKDVSRKMIDLWTSFAIDGTPKIASNPKFHWPPLTSKSIHSSYIKYSRY